MRNVPLYIIMCLIRRLFYIIVVIQRVVELLRSLLIITMLVTTWLTSWTLTTTFMTIITTTALRLDAHALHNPLASPSIHDEKVCTCQS